MGAGASRTARYHPARPESSDCPSAGAAPDAIADCVVTAGGGLAGSTAEVQLRIGELKLYVSGHVIAAAAPGGGCGGGGPEATAAGQVVGAGTATGSDCGAGQAWVERLLTPAQVDPISVRIVPPKSRSAPGGGPHNCEKGRASRSRMFKRHADTHRAGPLRIHCVTGASAPNVWRAGGSKAKAMQAAHPPAPQRSQRARGFP